jgi:hypothetical protein
MVTTTKTAANKKAPTAWFMPMPTALVPITAAPGVDQAVIIGMRWRQLK